MSHNEKVKEIVCLNKLIRKRLFELKEEVQLKHNLLETNYFYEPGDFGETDSYNFVFTIPKINKFCKIIYQVKL